jgi:hypothetical protein
MRRERQGRPVSDERDDAGRTFLSRWSRRKHAARAAEAAPEPVTRTPDTAAPAAAPVTAEQAPALPEVESLEGLRSDYREFLRPDVGESLRRAALKKLFADPHFNVMDGLDVYIDDYSKPDPIPPALLRAMNQARDLRLFEEEEPAEAADAALQQDSPPSVTHKGDGEVVAAPAASTQCPETTEVPIPDPGDPAAERKTG